MNFYGKSIKNKTFAVWGLSFKPKTNDMREAPSIVITEKLIEAGANVLAYDPEAMEEAKWRLNKKVVLSKTAYSALKGANALVIITEWNEFRTPDFNLISSELKDNVIFDGRNLFDLKDMEHRKINYFSIGRKEIRA
jgi:UDPglucose 6-dehydrogenase